MKGARNCAAWQEWCHISASIRTNMVLMIANNDAGVRSLQGCRWSVLGSQVLKTPSCRRGFQTCPNAYLHVRRRAGVTKNRLKKLALLSSVIKFWLAEFCVDNRMGWERSAVMQEWLKSKVYVHRAPKTWGLFNSYNFINAVVMICFLVFAFLSVFVSCLLFLYFFLCCCSVSVLLALMDVLSAH
jgi:hypothetical protein